MSQAAKALGAAVALTLVLAGCIHMSHSSAPTTTSSTVRATTTTTTLPAGVQAPGPRTVLSPIGLNVRAGPSKTAKVLGSAAQGVSFAVLGYTSAGGGWYHVKGQAVPGWISASPTLSAAGNFLPYQSNPLGFGVLYPSDWLVTPTAASSVFRGPGTGEAVSITVGVSDAALGSEYPDDVVVTTQTVVPCGVTTTMYSYPAGANGSGVRAEVRIPVSAKHILRIFGAFAKKTGVSTFLDFVNSVTFTSPQCQG